MPISIKGLTYITKYGANFLTLIESLTECIINIYQLI